MEKKKFFSDVLFVQGINILIKAIWILWIDRVVQDLLPKEDYGRYFSLFSFTILFIILLDFGINSQNTRMVATDTNYYRQNFSGFMVAKLLLSGFFLLVVYLSAFLMGYSNLYWELLIPLSIFQIFISFNLYLRSNIAAIHRFKLDGILAVVDRLLVVLVCGSWLLVEEWNHLLTIQNFVLIQLAGVIFTFVLGMWFNLNFVGKPEFSFRFKNVTNLIKTSLPYALLAALMAFYTRIDAVMVDSMLGAHEADRYAMAYRLLDAGNMIAVLLAGMLLPMFARLIPNSSEIGKLTKLSFKFLVVPAFFMAIMVGLNAQEILTLMYPNKIDIQPPETFVVLMFSFVGICAIYIYGTLLTAAGDVKFLNKLAALTAILNMGFNLLLIPNFGIVGAAIATLCTQSAFALGCYFKSYTWRRTVDESGRKWIFPITILVCSLLILLSKQFFENSFVHIAFGAIVILGFVVNALFNSSNELKLMSRRKTQEPSNN